MKQLMTRILVLELLVMSYCRRSCVVNVEIIDHEIIEAKEKESRVGGGGGGALSFV
jgi:hypothetical protein